VKDRRAFWLVALVLFAWASIAAPTLPALQQPQKQAADDEDEPKTPADKAARDALIAKACGPKASHNAKTDKKQHPTPEAPADKALVYVIRPTMMGNKIQTKLAVDGKWVGVNRGNNYFFITLDPGEHYFCSQAENKSVFAMKVEAGKTYFLQQKIRMGFMKASNKLEAISDEEGRKGLAKCHPSLFEEKK
jgi:hypothetical protein